MPVTCTSTPKEAMSPDVAAQECAEPGLQLQCSHAERGLRIQARPSGDGYPLRLLDSKMAHLRFKRSNGSTDQRMSAPADQRTSRSNNHTIMSHVLGG